MLERWAGKARVTLSAAGDGAARAYSGAKEGGIIPSKLEIAGDGSVIPPAYVWWAPWAARIVFVVAAGIVGLPFGLAVGASGSSPDNLTSAFMTPVGVAIFLMVAAFNLDSFMAWGVCVLLIPGLGMLLTESTSFGVLFAIFGVISVIIGGMYRRADFDAATADALEQIAEARRSHGRGYMLEEILEDDGGHEKLVTLGDPDGGAPRNQRIRHVPDGVHEGWYIVVDPARRFMTGMPPAMLRRVESLGGRA